MSDTHPYALLRCDACGCLVDAPRSVRGGGADDSDQDAPAASGAGGRGLLLFVRADEVRYEEPPLCARCSVAIGVTALVRWAEEEEEG
ncbi:MAG TPA: hypothetical protein VFZ61_06155 [Polyangiales bacterium]